MNIHVVHTYIRTCSFILSIPLSTVFQPLYKAVWRTRSVEITPGNTSVVDSPLLVDILDAASTDTGVEEGPAGCGPSATHTTYVS